MKSGPFLIMSFMLLAGCGPSNPEDQPGYSEGYEAGVLVGQEAGFKKGKEEGFEEGKEEGLREGKEEGLREGKEEGLREGKEEGEQEVCNAAMIISPDLWSALSAQAAC